MILVSKQKTTTSNGCLSKAWYAEGSNLYLVKGNRHYNTGFDGYEPFAEVIASIVADVLNIPHIPYTLAASAKFPDVHTYNCNYVSVCPQYLSRVDAQKLSATEYIDAFFGKSIESNFWSAIIRTPVDKQTLCDMLVFDAVIGNNDRHLNNWEYQITVKGEVQQLPLFDNGSSLLAFEKQLPHSIHKLGRDLAKPFARTHFEQISLIKKTYPSYRFKVDIKTAWDLIEMRIKPILALIPEKRVNIMLEYLYKRFYYYLTYINDK